MDWIERQSLSSKIALTLFFFSLTVGEHMLFFGASLEIHVVLIFVGMVGLGFHCWFVGSLLCALTHDNRKHHQTLTWEWSMAYNRYLESLEPGSKPELEEEWGKRVGAKMIWI